MNEIEEKQHFEQALEACRDVLLGEASGFVYVVKDMKIEHKDHADNATYSQMIGNRFDEFKMVGHLERAKLATLQRLQTHQENNNEGTE